MAQKQNVTLLEVSLLERDLLQAACVLASQVAFKEDNPELGWALVGLGQKLTQMLGEARRSRVIELLEGNIGDED